MSDDTTGPRGWPTQWWDLDRLAEPRREAAMIRIARDVAGPRLDGLVAEGVLTALRGHPVPIDDAVGVGGRHLPHILAHIDAATHPLVHRRSHDDAELRAWTHRDRRAVRSAWADHCLRLQERATALALLVRRLAAQVAGDLAVTDEDGVVLTGEAALRERRRIYGAELCTEWRRCSRHDLVADWLLAHTADDTAEGALSPDLRTAQQQLLERLDDAARDHIAYLLDAEDPAYARPVGTEQISALALIDSRRQAARRQIRAAANVAAARTAGADGVRRVSEVPVEHAPAWRDSAGGHLTLAAGMLLAVWTAPARGRWKLSLTAARTDQRRAVLHPPIVLDLPDLPAGWDVSIGPRHASLPRWPVTLTAPAAPAPGVYDIDLVARDDVGPGDLTVRVTVPAPAASE